jgi:hypothetical protein
MCPLLARKCVTATRQVPFDRCLTAWFPAEPRESRGDSVTGRHRPIDDSHDAAGRGPARPPEFPRCYIPDHASERPSLSGIRLDQPLRLPPDGRVPVPAPAPVQPGELAVAVKVRARRRETHQTRTIHSWNRVRQPRLDLRRVNECHLDIFFKQVPRT